MTLIDPPSFDNNAYLFVQSVAFPQVLALPERHSLPEGDLLTFRFSNGYGAAVMRSTGLPQGSAFEFGVLDCTGPEPQLTVLTPVCSSLMHGLSYDQVAQLLPHAEGLPLHPELERAHAALEGEDF